MAQVKVCCLNYESTTNVASFPGHSQILSHSCGELFLHGYRIKFGGQQIHTKQLFSYNGKKIYIMRLQIFMKQT